MMNPALRSRLLAFALLSIALPPGAAVAQTAIQIAPQDLSTVNGSVVIVTGNTFQQVLPAATTTQQGQPGRRSLTIQNNNTTDSCWITFGTFGGAAITAGTATTGRSILLTAGGSFQRYSPFVPSDAIIATCATTSDTLYIDTQ